MKQLAILSLCALVAVGAGAQKPVEEQAKKAGTYAEAVEIIKVAPEGTTPGVAYYYVGEKGFKEYDQMLGNKMMGKTVDEPLMARTLIGADKYFRQAVKNADVPNAKGKTDNKFMSKVGSQLAGHYHDYSNAGIILWGEKDFDGAIEAWQIYLDLPKDPAVQASKLVADHDSITSSIVFNQGLAYYNTGDKLGALNKFLESKDMYPADKQVYDFALSVAQEINRPDTILAICQEAMPKYGKEDNIYLMNIINVYNNQGKVKEAETMVAQALQSDPSNAELYRMQGYLFENTQNPAAFDSYKKAYELAKNNAQMAYDYARMMYNRGNDIEEATATKDYGRVRQETLLPLYGEALQIVSPAPAIDEEKYPQLKSQINSLVELLNYKLGKTTE